RAGTAAPRLPARAPQSRRELAGSRAAGRPWWARSCGLPDRPVGTPETPTPESLGLKMALRPASGEGPCRPVVAWMERPARARNPGASLPIEVPAFAGDGGPSAADYASLHPGYDQR